jgi:hypothetical protein
VAPPDYATTANEPTEWTTQDELDRLDKLEEKYKQVMKEAEVKSNDTKAKFEYAHWRCVKSGAIFRRDDIASIENHRSKCAYCLETIEQRVKEKEDKQEAISRINYVFHEIESAKLDKELAEAYLDNKKRFNLEELPPTKYIQLAFDNAQARLNVALKDKHLLLNHENETYRKAADEIHQKYINMTPKQKRDRYVHGVTI